MEYRELANTGEKVSAIGVGTWVTGGRNWGGQKDDDSLRAFGHAIDLGINFFDTAPVYGYGRAETVLGEVLKTKRDQVFLATKFGLVWEHDQQEMPTNNLHPKSIRKECEESLKRLNTQVIDLYQAHWPLQGEAMTRTVAEDMVAELEDLRDKGEIRYFGVSNFSIKQMEWCEGGRKLTSLQPPLSVLRPGATNELIPWCEDQGISVVCYSPLFRGLLTGKYKGDETFPEDDSRAKHPDYAGKQFVGICKAAQGLKKYADYYGTSIAGIALNWVLSTPGVTVAIAGTRTASQIEDAVRGQGFQLTEEERQEITERFAPYAKVF